VPLALLLRASCPSQRSVPPSCRPGVAKQARLGRWISPGGSLRVAWVVRVSSQAAHNVTRSPPDQTHTHPSAGKRSSTKYTRSPSTLAAYSQTHPHTGPFRGSAIVPTISFVLSRAPKRCLPRIYGHRGSFIHRSAWKVNSRKFGCSILYSSRLSGRVLPFHPGPKRSSQHYILWW